MTFDELIGQSLTPEKLLSFLAAYKDSQEPGDIGLQDKLPMRAMAPMLANISLMERKDHQNIVYRIVGENIVSRLGLNPTGSNIFDFLAPAIHEETAMAMQIGLSQPCGHYAIYENQYESGRRMVTESLVLPMRKHSGADANLILGYHVHHQATNTYALGARTSLFVDWSVADFVDLGFGLPADLDVARPSAAERDLSIRERPQSAVG